MFTQRIKLIKLWTAYTMLLYKCLSQRMDQPPSQTDSTMKDLYTAPEAIQEAFRIQMEIYRDNYNRSL